MFACEKITYFYHIYEMILGHGEVPNIIERI